MARKLTPDERDMCKTTALAAKAMMGTLGSALAAFREENPNAVELFHEDVVRDYLANRILKIMDADDWTRDDLVKALSNLFLLCVAMDAEESENDESESGVDNDGQSQIHDSDRKSERDGSRDSSDRDNG